MNFMTQPFFKSFQAQQIGKYLHHFALRAKFSRTKKIIKWFSLQLLQQKIQILPCGFFQIDLILFYSVTSVAYILLIKFLNKNISFIWLQFVGAVTTYLIILIQFDLQGHSKTLINSTILGHHDHSSNISELTTIVVDIKNETTSFFMEIIWKLIFSWASSHMSVLYIFWFTQT